MSNQIISAYVDEIVKRFDKVLEVHENRLKYLNLWLDVCENENKVVEIVSEALDHEPIRYKDSIESLRKLFKIVNHTYQSPNIYSYTDNVVTILGEIINKVTKDFNVDSKFRNYLTTVPTMNNPLNYINKLKEESLKDIDLPTAYRLKWEESAEILSHTLSRHYTKPYQVFEQIPYLKNLYKYYSSYSISYLKNLLENTKKLPNYYFGDHNKRNFHNDSRDKDIHLWLKMESGYIYDHHPEYDHLMFKIKNDLKTLELPLIDAFLLDYNLSYVNYIDSLCKIDDIIKMVDKDVSEHDVNQFLSTITLYDVTLMENVAPHINIEDDELELIYPNKVAPRPIPYQERVIQYEKAIQQKDSTEPSQDSTTTSTQDSESTSSDTVTSTPSMKSPKLNVVTNQSVVDFWNHFAPQFKWEAIPYNFAYDLYQAWSTSPLNQNEFKEQSIQWCQDTNQYIPKFGNLKIVVRDRMDQTEPIIKEYGLTQYENYKPKTTRGYLKNH